MFGGSTMRKKVFLVILAISLSVLVVSPQMSLVAQATSKIDSELDRLKKIKEIAQQKAREAEVKISQVKNQQKTTKAEMETLLDQMEAASQKLAQLNENIDQVSEELVQNGKLLDEASKRVESRNELLKSRLRIMYMNGVVSYMDVLLSATNFNDFVNRMEILTGIAMQDKQLLDTEKNDRELIITKKQQTEKQLEEVKQLYNESNQVRQELAVKENLKEQKLASLKEQEHSLEEISEENEKLLIDYAKQEAALLKEKSELLDLPYNGGKMGYPLLKKAIITSYFGYRIDPITGKKGAFHSGLDLGVPKGTTILAAETGVVIVASWFGGYGNCVIIDHGNDTWTLYGHIRDEGIIVKKGDRVIRGQKIAEVGSTGRSTGNHLHFEIRVNSKTVDPLPYLN